MRLEKVFHDFYSAIKKQWLQDGEEPDPVPNRKFLSIWRLLSGLGLGAAFELDAQFGVDR